MGVKKFFIKQALKLKGIKGDQAEQIAEQLSNNPELASSLKKLEENKQLKSLFDKIQKEIEEKKKSGTPEAFASMSVMTKYKAEITKHKDDLAPLMQLFMGGK